MSLMNIEKINLDISNDIKKEKTTKSDEPKKEKSDNKKETKSTNNQDSDNKNDSECLFT